VANLVADWGEQEASRVRIGDVVTWRWEGVSPDGEVLGAGLEFVVLAADGRIATDYQFVE
jgi:hypothetical protein